MCSLALECVAGARFAMLWHVVGGEVCGCGVCSGCVVPACEVLLYVCC